MAHELVIKYGVVINNTQTITGVTTDSGLTSNSNFVIPTERAVKQYVNYTISQSLTETSYTLSGLTDVAFGTPISGNFLYYNGTKWTNKNLVLNDITNYIDSQYVHTNSAETINGIKTFTSPINVNTINTQAGVLSIDVLNRRMMDVSNATGLTWQDRLLIDSSNRTSLNWNNRLLINSTGNTKLDWENEIINGTQWNINSNVLIVGNLFVSGSTTSTVCDNMNLTDNLITLNSGETGAGVTLEISGIKIDRGSLPYYYFVFDEVTDTFRVGLSGETKTVATRENDPINLAIPYWNNTLNRFDTNINLYWNTGTSTLISNNVNIINLTATTAFVSNLSSNNFISTNITGTTAYVSNLSSNIFNTNSLNTNGITGTTLYLSSNANIIGTLRANVLSGTSINTTSGNIVNLTATTLFSSNLTSNNLITNGITGSSLYVSGPISSTGLISTSNNISAVGTISSSQMNSNIISGSTLYVNSGFLGQYNIASISSSTAVNGDIITWNSANSTLQTQNIGNILTNYLYKSSATTSTVDAIIDSVSTSLMKGIIWNFVISNSDGMRTGTLQVIYSGSTVEYNEYSTQSIGVVNCELKAHNTGSLIQLRTASITGTYNIYATRILI